MACKVPQIETRTSMELIERIILSIYFYEKKYESKRFFDAWWQFSHSLGYAAIGIIIILINLICGTLGLRINPYLYALPILLEFGITWLKNDFRDSPFYSYVERSYKEVRPVSRWIIWGIAVIIILCVAWSMAFNIESTRR